MNYITAIFLGLVQGIAEFLPISSSGHLALFQHFFGLTNAEENYMFFDVLLHLGTLISIFIVYWKDIVALVKELVRFLTCIFSKEKRKQMDRLPPDGRMVLMLIIATLPLFAVYPIKDKVEGLYSSSIFIGCALLATGFILFFADRMARGRKTARSATMLDALLVGIGQAIAVIPGLSRSGTTISAGMVRGFQRHFSVRFSFLLSIPAVLGANIVSLKDVAAEGIDGGQLPMYLVGMVVAAVAGYFAIHLVNRMADKGKFGNFAYYCWGVGAAAVVATLIFH